MDPPSPTPPCSEMLRRKFAWCDALPEPGTFSFPFQKVGLNDAAIPGPCSARRRCQRDLQESSWAWTDVAVAGVAIVGSVAGLTWIAGKLVGGRT